MLEGPQARPGPPYEGRQTPPVHTSLARGSNSFQTSPRCSTDLAPSGGARPEDASCPSPGVDGALGWQWMGHGEQSPRRGGEGAARAGKRGGVGKIKGDKCPSLRQLFLLASR